MTRARRDTGEETTEIKGTAVRYHEVEAGQSEWEIARMTSKTWSMEQE